MDEDTALTILRQIEIDEKNTPSADRARNIHQQFDGLVADFLRQNGFKKLADYYENPCSVHFGYDEKA